MATSIPRRVTVGPFVYTVTVADELDEQRMGMVDFRHQTIDLLRDQPPMQMRDTLLHEVMHAVVRFAGLDMEENERVVAALSSILLMVLRANPRLVAHLVAADA